MIEMGMVGAIASRRKPCLGELHNSHSKTILATVQIPVTTQEMIMGMTTWMTRINLSPTGMAEKWSNVRGTTGVTNLADDGLVH